MTPDVKLSPCPFCGKADAFVERADYSSSYVQCNECSARGPTECQESDREAQPGEAAAVRAWNRRALLTDSASQLERMRKALKRIEALALVRAEQTGGFDGGEHHEDYALIAKAALARNAVTDSGSDGGGG